MARWLFRWRMRRDLLRRAEALEEEAAMRAAAMLLSLSSGDIMASPPGSSLRRTAEKCRIETLRRLASAMRKEAGALRNG